MTSPTLYDVTNYQPLIKKLKTLHHPSLTHSNIKVYWSHSLKYITYNISYEVCIVYRIQQKVFSVVQTNGRDGLYEDFQKVKLNVYLDDCLAFDEDPKTKELVKKEKVRTVHKERTALFCHFLLLFVQNYLGSKTQKAASRSNV